MELYYKTLGKYFDSVEKAKAYEDEFLKDKKEIAFLIIDAFRDALFDHCVAVALACQFTNFHRITFGQYKGEYIGAIILYDSSYINWCIENVPNFKLTPEELLLFENNYKGLYYHRDSYKYCFNGKFSIFEVQLILKERYLEKYGNPKEDKNFSKFNLHKDLSSESIIDDVVTAWAGDF